MALHWQAETHQRWARQVSICVVGCCALSACLLTADAPCGPPAGPAPLADQQQYWARDPGTFQFVSAQGIADAFYGTTDAGRAIVQVLETPFDPEGAEVDSILMKTK